MADAGFFKGTSIDQDRRFADKENRLMRSLTFPPEFNQKVDMRKVNLQVMRPWITKKVVELVGFEDDVVVEYAMGLLEDQSKPIDPKLMQINLTGFLESKTPAFMTALWALLLDAQKSPAGVPSSFVQEKKEELRQKHEADERALAEARRRGEHDLRLDESSHLNPISSRRSANVNVANAAATVIEADTAAIVVVAVDKTRSAADHATADGVTAEAGEEETVARLVVDRRLEVVVAVVRQNHVGGDIDVRLRRDGHLLPWGGVGPRLLVDADLLRVVEGARGLEEVDGRLHPAVEADVHHPQEVLDGLLHRQGEGALPLVVHHHHVVQRSARPEDVLCLLKAPRLVLGFLSPDLLQGHGRGPGLLSAEAVYLLSADPPVAHALVLTLRSPSREREDEPDAGVNVQPLSIKGAAETAKKGRWEAEDDDKTANARIESELRENLLRQKVMKTRKGRRGSEVE